MLASEPAGLSHLQNKTLMHLDHFKKLTKEVVDLEKTGAKFDVLISNDNVFAKGNAHAIFHPANFEVTSLKQLAEVQRVLGRTINFNANDKVTIAGLSKAQNCVSPVAQVSEFIRLGKTDKKAHPTLKFFFPQLNVGQYGQQNSGIQMISLPPFEQIEEEITYRYIGNQSHCHFCIPHTHPLYNYLDQGFFYCTLINAGKETMVITNELNLDTLCCFNLLSLAPRHVKELQNGCFINSAIAKVLRIKLEKLILTEVGNYHANVYNQNKGNALREYEKVVNSGLIRKVLDGALPHGVYNNMRFTKNSATYETITIQADNLLEFLADNLVFDERTDIYTLVRTYITLINNAVEAAPLTVSAETPVATIEKTFTINGIPMSIGRTSENSRRYVKGIAINKEEVETVCNRAACFTDEATYIKFVTSVHKMSLKWHDAIANGVGVKIHDGMSHDEYRGEKAPLSAPKLKFRIEDGDVKLQIDDNSSVKIKFNDFLKKIEVLNRRVNNGYSSHVARDVVWARTELTNLIKECCTFVKKTLIVGEEDGEPVLDDKGKKQYTSVNECLITDTQAAMIERIAREYQKKALERSKLMLAKAMKDTNARIEKYNGVDYYVVKGSMREYGINSTNNQVNNWETKGHICIVEQGHTVGVGADSTVVRLYSLKNDSMLVRQIGTLNRG